MINLTCYYYYHYYHHHHYYYYYHHHYFFFVPGRFCYWLPPSGFRLESALGVIVAGSCVLSESVLSAVLAHLGQSRVLQVERPTPQASNCRHRCSTRMKSRITHNSFDRMLTEDRRCL